MYSAVEIANYFVKKSLEDKKPLTQMQLQKLLYFAYGLFLVRNKGEKRLFDSRFEAWEYGPVLPEIYHEFKTFGANPITPENDIMKFLGKGRDFEKLPSLSSEAEKTINDTWTSLKQFNGVQLSIVTHRENGAWKSVYQPQVKNIPISDEAIQADIKSLLTEEEHDRISGTDQQNS